MDLVTAVVICNCTIAIVTISITIWMMDCRRQIVGLTNFFDRCLSNWQGLEIDAATMMMTANRIQHLRQIYQQQLGTLDRLQRLRSLFGLARFAILKRRSGFTRFRN